MYLYYECCKRNDNFYDAINLILNVLDSKVKIKQKKLKKIINTKNFVLNKKLELLKLNEFVNIILNSEKNKSKAKVRVKDY